MGDMNSAPPGPELAGAAPGPLAEAVDRTWSALTSGRLRDALRRADPRRHWDTYPARTPERPIDWVLASHELLPEEARVLEDLHSDHLGVAVRFAFLPAPGSAGE
jgi:endonuclease/exonuclease/phosphatase family metal-dependent hydrolase